MRKGKATKKEKGGLGKDKGVNAAKASLKKALCTGSVQLGKASVSLGKKLAASHQSDQPDPHPHQKSKPGNMGGQCNPSGHQKPIMILWQAHLHNSKNKGSDSFLQVSAQFTFLEIF